MEMNVKSSTLSKSTRIFSIVILVVLSCMVLGLTMVSYKSGMPAESQGVTFEIATLQPPAPPPPVEPSEVAPEPLPSVQRRVSTPLATMVVGQTRASSGPNANTRNLSRLQGRLISIYGYMTEDELNREIRRFMDSFGLTVSSDGDTLLSATGRPLAESTIECLINAYNPERSHHKPNCPRD